jgi:alanyl-tRNA synthetase
MAFRQIVLDTTPFYPEGGTSRDKGTLVSANETIEIIDTKENNDFAFCKSLPSNVNRKFCSKD